ncbi:MAG TPA: hypothetical protein VK826_14250 [Bacteroidia bacterium]|nr:hypothetical protein [Bacteroidia bacterium]
MEPVKFEERQYHGLNRHSLVRRMLLSVFCFVAYYWSENPKPVDVSIIHIGEYPGDLRYGELFFVLGLVLIALSVALLFVPHMKTVVTENGIVLTGKFPGRRVEIPFSSVVSARKITIRPSIFNRPVFNLHTKGRIRFYTWGNEMIEIAGKDGKVFRVGSQRSTELMNVLKTRLSTNHGA